MKYKVLAFADTHVGSNFGLFPKNFKARYELNPIQEILWEYWTDFCAKLPRLDVVMLVGDPVEGRAKFTRGAGLCEIEPSKQVEAAVVCCNMVIDKMKPGSQWYSLAGSDYHVGRQKQHDFDLASKLAKDNKKKKFEVVTDGQDNYAHIWLHLDVGGVKFDVAHHRSVAMINRAMPLERELRFNAISQALHQGEDDIIIRAHAHTDIVVAEGYRLAIGLPSWKCQDEYCAGSKTPNRMLSRWLGAFLITIDTAADDPISYKKLFYPHPILERHTYVTP